MKIQFGTARRCITPQEPISLSGYFNRRVWDHILDDLEVRAIVFKDGKKLAAIIPQIQAAALHQAREELLRAISFDVETVVSVAFANGETIWRDSKTQKVIADSLMREIRKRLDGFKI